MSRQVATGFPAVERLLREVGQNIRNARLRRQITAELLAERAGMSRPTLRSIERGDASVTVGALANVLHSLGLEQDLLGLARADVLGRRLDDAALERQRRVRAPRRIVTSGVKRGR
jgi:transcriptional regulator with XRE-family HTH domain